MVQAEEAATEITRKLKKQEKKCLKKEKKRLAAIALASSENSSAPEECLETNERPKKKKKQKPQEALQENGMENPSVSFSKAKKKKSFSKEELVSNDLEKTAGTGSLPKWKKSIPKEEPVTDPDESENEGPQEKAELVFQGGATQQWTWRGCCQQEQCLQEKEKALQAIPGRLEWTSSECGMTYRGIPHSIP